MRKFICVLSLLLLVGCTIENPHKRIDGRVFQTESHVNEDSATNYLRISVGHENNFYLVLGSEKAIEGTYEKVEEFESVYVFKYGDQSQMVFVDEEQGFYFAYPNTENIHRLEFFMMGTIVPTQ